MKQGTVSILIGTHSLSHTIITTIAWRQIYKRWPHLWELGCIILHDIGHYNTNYLDNYKEKKNHWKLGANIANMLFGIKGFYLIAGHCPDYSNIKKSNLYLPDKKSRTMTPFFISMIDVLVEPKLVAPHLSRIKSIKLFKKLVTEAYLNNDSTQSHEIYTKLQKGDYIE